MLEEIDMLLSQEMKDAITALQNSIIEPPACCPAT
jgi:hypothetical protein